VQYRLGTQGLYAAPLPTALLALYPQVIVILRLDLWEKQQTGGMDSSLHHGVKAQLAQYPGTAGSRPEFERGCSDTESLTLAFAVSYGEVEMANDR
jgi:hypothetical protein